MDHMGILLALAIGVGFYMAWNIGANDVANSMADAVGSKAIGFFGAVVLAAICEFAGAVLAGSHVADTVRKGIIDPAAFTSNPGVLATGLVCALLAAAVWLNAASIFGVPVSTTHSIVGAVAGFGILGGIGQVHWGTMGRIVASWVISPVAGGVVAFLIFKLLSRFILTRDKPLEASLIGAPVCTFFTFMIVTLAVIYKGLKNLKLDFGAGPALLISAAVGLAAAAVVFSVVRHFRKRGTDVSVAGQLVQVEKVFAVIVVITSCSVAFSHGANDVANAIGPLAAVVDIVRKGQIAATVGIDLWVLALGGAGIVIGLATFGYRVMRTVGTKITEISPSRGVAADVAATLTVLTCSRLGLPVSTTHTLVGAIIGVGLARGVSAVNRKTVKLVFTSWLINLPVVAAMTIVLYLAVRLFTGSWGA